MKPALFHSVRNIGLASALLLLLSPVARAQPAARNAPADVVRTVVRFVAAVHAADRDELLSLVWAGEGSEAQQRGREHLVDLIVAEKRLERLAADRFGAGGVLLQCRFDQFLDEQDRKALAAAPVQFEEQIDAARLAVDGQAWPLRFRRGPQGSWQVVLDVIDYELEDEYGSYSRPDGRARLRVERLAQTVRAVTEVGDRVGNGQLSTAAAAVAELNARVAEIAAEYNRLRAESFRRRSGAPGRFLRP